MIDNLNHGGRIAMLGLPSQPIEIDWGNVVTHMITIKGIYGREMFETWYAMSAMLRSGRCDISPRSSPTASPPATGRRRSPTARRGRRAARSSSTGRSSDVRDGSRAPGGAR